jgi:hypothetical protein
MKPSVAALIRPRDNTSMPALIAEEKRTEKRANMEYAAHSGNRASHNNVRTTIIATNKSTPAITMAPIVPTNTARV